MNLGSYSYPIHTLWPNSTLRLYLKEMTRKKKKKVVCTKMVIETIFIILGSWKNLKNSTIALRLNKLEYIIKLENYGTLTRWIHRNIN